MLQDYPAILVMINIEPDPTLHEKFKERIPLLKIDGIDSFVYKVNKTTLRYKLDWVKS